MADSVKGGALKYALRISLSVCSCVSGLVLSSDVKAYEPFYNSQNRSCPYIAKNTNWKDYISGFYEGNQNRGVSFGVQFRYHKEVNDPAAMYFVDPQFCYGINYYGDGSWMPGRIGFESLRAIGYELSGTKYDYNYLEKQPGDPKQWEINVDGHIFLFNQAGEVLDMRGRRVGQMVCYKSNECSKYK